MWTKLEISSSRPTGKPRSIVSMRSTLPSLRHDQDFLVLAREGRLSSSIVDEGERQVLVGLGPFDVLVDRPVEHIQEQLRVLLAALLKGARDRLHHQHQHAALQPMAGDVADADLDAVAGLQDVVIVAADLVGRLHVARDVEMRDRVELVRLRQHHHLDAASHVELGAEPQVLALQLLVEGQDLLVGLARAARSVRRRSARGFRCGSGFPRPCC